MEVASCNFCGKEFYGHKVNQIKQYYLQHLIARHKDKIAVWSEEAKCFVPTTDLKLGGQNE